MQNQNLNESVYQYILDQILSMNIKPGDKIQEAKLASELGISRTIRLGLEQLGHCDGVLFMTADQPYLTQSTLRRLAEAFAADPAGIHAAAHNGQRGNPCLFPRDCFPALLQLQGDRGGGSVIARNLHRLRLTEVSARELADADTPEALAALRGTCGRCDCSV